MIVTGPDAALELLAARDHYEFPYAFAYLVRPNGDPHVLATEQLQRAPLDWAARLRSVRR
jgi:hypothetical protein